MSKHILDFNGDGVVSKTERLMAFFIGYGVVAFILDIVGVLQ